MGITQDQYPTRIANSAQPPPSSRRWLAWLPILLLLAAMIVLRTMHLHSTYESPYLLIVLSFIFSTLTSLCIVFLMGRSFIKLGTPGLLLLGCGALILGIASSVAVAAGSKDANSQITIYNTCVWLSALCHLAGVVLSFRSQRTLSVPGVWLGIFYLLALGVVGLVTRAALAGWLPPFFVQGQGGTLVRYLVLVSAIAIFVLTAVLLRLANRPSMSPFAYWYALSLLLISVALFGAMILSSAGSPLGWTCRAAQYLGGVYMLVAALAVMRASRIPLVSLETRLQETRYRFSVAFVVVIVAAVVRLLFLPELGAFSPFLLFYPAVMLAALYGGLQTGLLATVLSVLVADYFWLRPTGNLAIAKPADWLGVIIFLLSGMMICWITEAMRRAQIRSQRAETESSVAAARLQGMERLREQAALLNLAHDAIMVLDMEDRITFWNQGAEATYGWTNAEALGRAAGELLQTSFPQPLAEISARLAEDGGWEGELTHTRKDGRQIVVASRWAVQRDENGRQMGVLEINRNVTENKLAEEALRDATQRLTYHVDHSPLAVIEWGPDMRLTRWSGAAERLFGWKAEEVLGKRMEDFRWIYQEDLGQVAEVSDELQTGKNSHRFSANRNYRKDGSVVHCEWYNSSLLDASGQLRSILSLVLDVTERKQAEATLRESERRERERAEELSVLLEAVPMAVFIARDPDCLHLSGNRLADEILRIPTGNELSLSAPADTETEPFPCRQRRARIAARRTARPARRPRRPRQGF